MLAYSIYFSLSDLLHSVWQTLDPSTSLQITQLLLSWDFPGGPVVKILPSNAGSAGSIPGWGAKIPHAPWPKNQNIKQKQCCNKFKKYFKKWSTSNKKNLKKNYYYPNYTSLIAWNTPFILSSFIVAFRESRRCRKVNYLWDIFFFLI